MPPRGDSTLLGKRRGRQSGRQDQKKEKKLSQEGYRGPRRGRPSKADLGEEEHSEYYEPESDGGENGVDFMDDLIQQGLKKEQIKKVFQTRDLNKNRKDYEEIIQNSQPKKAIANHRSKIPPKSTKVFAKSDSSEGSRESEEKLTFKEASIPSAQSDFISPELQFKNSQQRSQTQIHQSTFARPIPKQLHMTKRVNFEDMAFRQGQIKPSQMPDRLKTLQDPFKDRLKQQFGTIFDDNDSISNCDSSESSSNKSCSQSSQSSNDKKRKKKAQSKNQKTSSNESQGSQDKVTKEYKSLIQKAQKQISYSKDQKAISKDSIKYYITKAMDYYKKAFQHCKTNKDQSRLYMMIGDCHLDLCPRQYEHDMKGKHLAKACECMKSSLDLSSEFDKEVVGDLQQKLIQLIQKQLIDKIEDSEFLCTLFEMIFATIHKKLVRLTNFVGSELYSVYYKIACEITDNRGDIENAQRYLEQCKCISKTIGIQDNSIIDLKLEDIHKMKKRKMKEKDVHEAKNCLHLGDLYMQNQQVKQALHQYQLCVKMCTDRDPETESLGHFKIGRIILHNAASQKELETAKNHLVNFQVQYQMIRDKSDSLQKKQKEAIQMLNHIQNVLKTKYGTPSQPQQQRPQQNQNTQNVNNDVTQKQNQKPKPQQTESKKQSTRYDFKRITFELEDQANKTIFEFLKYIKSTFLPKCGDIELVQKYSEPTKVRKQILKFISIFHPDKQTAEEKIFQDLAEEVTKHLNLQLKYYQ
eukprot:403358723